MKCIFPIYVVWCITWLKNLERYLWAICGFHSENIPWKKLYLPKKLILYVTVLLTISLNKLHWKAVFFFAKIASLQSTYLVNTMYYKVVFLVYYESPNICTVKEKKHFSKNNLLKFENGWPNLSHHQNKIHRLHNLINPFARQICDSFF